MKKIFLTVILSLSVALVISLRYGIDQREERGRLETNQRALLEESRRYRLRDSLNAVTVGVLTLRADEFRSHFEELNALIRDMNVKLRRVESVSQNSLESRYDISATVRDTVIAPPQPPGQSAERPLVTAQVISYRDAYIDLNGVMVDSVFRGTVVTYDTLTQVVHRMPRRFLFVRWGTRELRQEIVSSNPHTRIIYSRTIKLTR